MSFGFGVSMAQIYIQKQQSALLSTQPLRRENLDTGHLIKALIIGETGSGKSTFINYLTNYFKKGTLKNLRIAIPSNFYQQATERYDHNEHDVTDRTKSKTDSCSQYFFTDDNAQYIFLDTPGLSDTRGCEQDNINIEKIMNAIETLSGLTAVIIVVNGAVARLTVNLRNVIAQMRGNLPDVVMDNVIVILTNVTRHSSNFPLDALGLYGRIYPYYMQNSAFSTSPTGRSPTAVAALQSDWNQSMREVKAMIQTINTFKTKSVSAFQNMKEIRNTIKSLMHSTRVDIAQIQKMQDEIAMFETGLKQAQNDTVNYKDYTKERAVDHIEIIDAPYHSTLCQNCNHVCHNKCGLNEATTAGAQIFQQCWAITDGNCTQCQHKCSYTAHYHAKKTVRVTKKTLKDILADIKSRYDAASQDTLGFQKKIKSIKDAKELLEKAIEQKKTELIDNCQKLRRICSGFNLATELHVLIEQIRIDARSLRNIEAKTQAQALIQSLEELCNRIEHEQDHQREQMDQNAHSNIIDTNQHLESENFINRSDQDDGDPSSQLESQSHASEDVVNQIRAMAIKSSTKASTCTERSRLTENPAVMTEDDDSDHGNDKDRNHSSNTKTIAAAAIHPSAVLNVEQVKSLPTHELVSRYQTSFSDHRTATLIFSELTRRCHGKSTGPMTDPEVISKFTKIHHQYRLLNSQILQQKYTELKSKIGNIAEQDIVQIERVPLDWLLEIAAIYQLMQYSSDTDAQHDSNTPTFQNPTLSVHDPRFIPPIYYPEQRPQYPLQGTMPFASNYASPIRSESPYIHSPVNYTSESAVHAPRMHHAMYTGDPHNNFGHASSPGVAMMPPTNRHDPTSYLHHHQRDLYRENAFLHINPTYQPRHPVQYSMPPNILRPSPTYRESLPFQSSSLNHITNKMDTMHVTSPFTTISRDSHHSPSNSPTQGVLKSSSYTELNAHVQNSQIQFGDFSLEVLRRLSDVHLLSAYQDAMKSNNRLQAQSIYAELDRRCFGDHPILISEKRTLFEEKLRLFNGRSSQELNEVRKAIQKKIQTIIDGNAANLTDIPAHFIIEAAALNHCMNEN